MKRLAKKILTVGLVLKMSTTNNVKSEKEGKTQCYFCSEYFTAGQLQDHLKQCGSILEQCPLRCGAWIQRRHREQHMKDCPQYRRSSNSPTHAKPSNPSPPIEPMWKPKAAPVTDCVECLEKEVSAMRLSIAEETNLRKIQNTEVSMLRSKLILLDEQFQHLVSSLVSLRASADDEAERSANWISHFKHDITNLQLGMEDIQAHQKSLSNRIQNIVSEMVEEQRERDILEQMVSQHESKIQAMESLESAIEFLKQTVFEEKERGEECRVALEAEIEEARRTSQQLAQISLLRQDLQYQASNDHPALNKLAVLEVEAAAARQEAAEQSVRADLLARDLRALSKSYMKLKAEMTDFQARMTFERTDLGSDNGHLIWRIDNFSNRMKEAKDNDLVLSSPLFRTNKYGYTLKAEVQLNGVGKWRGRHVTCTVRLVGGPYDSLLEWPCDLHVNIVLKDQTANKTQAMDILKSLQVRRKSSSKRHDYDDAGETTRSTDNLSSDKTAALKRQYIFIPHASLDKFDYIKDDTIFIEFLVSQ